MPTCKSCGAEIEWQKSANDKWIPHDLNGQCHFDTCPDAKKFRKTHHKGSVVDFKEKISILKSWDLFLYETVRNEGISMSILESLASGVPVICSDHYGNKEIIEKGVNGFVYKDKPHAVKILSKLASNPDYLKELKDRPKGVTTLDDISPDAEAGSDFRPEDANEETIQSASIEQINNLLGVKKDRPLLL